MRWRTSGRRLLAAAAAAVVLHLLAAGAVLVWPRPRPHAPPRPAIAIVLQEGRSRPTPPSPPASALLTQPGATSTPAQPGATTRPGHPGATTSPFQRRAATIPVQRGAEIANRPTRGNPGTASLDQQRPDTGAALAGEGSAPFGPPPALTKDIVHGEGLAPGPGDRNATTVLRDPIATLDPRRPEPRQGPVHMASPEEKLVEEKTRVEGTLRGWTDDIAAKGRAEGPHDVYWRDMEEALAKGFEVDFDVSKRENDHPTSSVREALAAYQRAAESYGKGGSAYSDTQHRSLNGSMASGTVPAGDRGFSGTALEGPVAAVDLQLISQAAFGEGSVWNKKLVVLIQVVQSPDGVIEAAQVTTTSGNKAYDKTALSQVRKLAGKGLLGVPPDGRRRTVWAFETDFSTFPPLPIAGCAVDVLLIPRECYYPLKRTVRSRIRLEAIY